MASGRLQTNVTLALPAMTSVVVAARSVTQSIRVQKIVFTPSTFDSTTQLIFRDSLTQQVVGTIAGLNASSKRGSTARVLDFGGAGVKLSPGANLELLQAGGSTGGVLKVSAFQTPAIGQAIVTPAALATYPTTVNTRGTLYAAKVLVDGAIGYWRLGDLSGTVAVDQVASPHNGAYGTNMVLDQSGAIADGNFAVAADGLSATQSLVTITGTTTVLSANGAASWTIEAWMRSTTNDTQRFFVAKEKSSFQAYALSILSSGKIRVTFGFPVNSIKAVDSTGSTYNDGKYHHVVGVKRSTGNLEVWIDGVLDGTSVNSAFNIEDNANANLRIGNHYTADVSNAFIGTIDEVAVYNVELTGQQILDHYNLARN